MISAKAELIRTIVAEGTGAEIEMGSDTRRLQTALQIWFGDLSRSEGPSVIVGPVGLRRHSVKLFFGSFSGQILAQIARADSEEQQLSRALLSSISDDVSVVFPHRMNSKNWHVSGSNFKITAERRGIEKPLSDGALERTCRDIVVPLMAAMAELIGYDEVVRSDGGDDLPAFEGAEKKSVIIRRERNPRNRLLSLRLHGYVCQICQIDHRQIYGEAGAVLEIHHLEPLSNIGMPRVYDPETDLLPLCPTCHRVVHSRRPVPWTPQEVREMMIND